jgi:hypothetical protein
MPYRLASSQVPCRQQRQNIFAIKSALSDLHHLKRFVNEMTKSNPSSPLNAAGQSANPAELTLRKGSPFKRLPLVVFCGAALLLAGSRAPLVMQTPVGHEPFGRQTVGPDGQLLVFSAKEARGDGDDPIYYQHSDYSIYDSRGKADQVCW